MLRARIGDLGTFLRRSSTGPYFEGLQRVVTFHFGVNSSRPAHRVLQTASCVSSMANFTRPASTFEVEMCFDGCLPRRIGTSIAVIPRPASTFWAVREHFSAHELQLLAHDLPTCVPMSRS